MFEYSCVLLIKIKYVLERFQKTEHTCFTHLKIFQNMFCGIYSKEKLYLYYNDLIQA